MAKKKKAINGLTKSSDIKLKQTKKVKKKVAGVKQLNPKAPNKDSLTSNIQSRSAKNIKDSSLGKIQKLPLSQKRNDAPKKKKK